MADSDPEFLARIQNCSGWHQHLKISDVLDVLDEEWEIFSSQTIIMIAPVPTVKGSAAFEIRPFWCLHWLYDYPNAAYSRWGTAEESEEAAKFGISQGIRKR